MIWGLRTAHVPFDKLWLHAQFVRTPGLLRFQAGGGHSNDTWRDLRRHSPAMDSVGVSFPSSMDSMGLRGSVGLGALERGATLRGTSPLDVQLGFT